MSTATLAEPQSAPYRDADFMPVDLEVERRDDGTVILRSRVPLGDYDSNLPRALAQSAQARGPATAIAVRRPFNRPASSSPSAVDVMR